MRFDQEENTKKPEISPRIRSAQIRAPKSTEAARPIPTSLDDRQTGGADSERASVVPSPREGMPLAMAGQMPLDSRKRLRNEDKKTEEASVTGETRRMPFDQRQYRPLKQTIRNAETPKVSEEALSDRLGKTMVRRKHERSGLKGNVLDEPKTTRFNSFKSKSDKKISGKTVLKAKLKKKSSEREKPWTEEAYSGAKIYRLSAYTTIDKIDRRFKVLRRQRILQRAFVTLVLTLALIILVLKYLPIKNREELNRIMGRQDELDVLFNDLD